MSDQPVVNDYIDTKASPFKDIQEHPDRYLIGLGVAPLICALAALVLGMGGIGNLLLFLVPNIALALLDERELKRSGRHVPEHWSVFVVPVYIWMRLKLNGQDKKLFYGWLVAFAVSFMLGSMADSKALASQSCDLVTQIIEDNLHGGASCIGVEINKEVRSGFYKATATLDNGNDVGITIDTTKSGQVYVQIVN